MGNILLVTLKAVGMERDWEQSRLNQRERGNGSRNETLKTVGNVTEVKDISASRKHDRRDVTSVAEDDVVGCHDDRWLS